MAVVKRLVCLANSRKLNERCVAGKELSGGRPAVWVRPVSAQEHGELSKFDRQCRDGSDPRVLDVIDVPLLYAQPKGCQQENWMIDSGQRWTKVARVAWNDLEQLVDHIEPLWLNGLSSQMGLNDEVSVSLTADLKDSLRLVRVGGVTLSVFNYYGKRRVQGRFRHDRMEYRLWVTDPDCEEPYKAKPDGDYEIGESFLTISLGEPYKNAYWKLIAAIISRK